MAKAPPKSGKGNGVDGISPPPKCGPAWTSEELSAPDDPANPHVVFVGSNFRVAQASGPIQVEPLQGREAQWKVKCRSGKTSYAAFLNSQTSFGERYGRTVIYSPPALTYGFHLYEAGPQYESMVAKSRQGEAMALARHFLDRHRGNSEPRLAAARAAFESLGYGPALVESNMQALASLEAELTPEHFLDEAVAVMMPRWLERETKERETGRPFHFTPVRVRADRSGETVRRTESRRAAKSHRRVSTQGPKEGEGMDEEEEK